MDFAKLIGDRAHRPRVSASPRYEVTAERTMLGFDPSGEGDRTREVSVYLWLDQKADGSLWVQLDGGPTGHESFQVTEANVRAMQTRNWVACMGTRGRWDRLVVPCHAISSFFSWAGLALPEVA